jgi:hypothetical protein
MPVTRIRSNPLVFSVRDGRTTHIAALFRGTVLRASKRDAGSAAAISVDVMAGCMKAAIARK